MFAESETSRSEIETRFIDVQQVDRDKTDMRRQYFSRPPRGWDVETEATTFAILSEIT